MSMTKNFYHEEINELSLETRNSIYEATGGHFDSYPMAIAEAEEPLISEITSAMFSHHQISPDGYEEFICDLCHKPNTSDFPHKECSDREQAWSDAQSETEDWDAE